MQIDGYTNKGAPTLPGCSSSLTSTGVFGGTEKITSPLVGEVGTRSVPGEGKAAKPPTASASPSPQPLPHQGGGAENYAAESPGSSVEQRRFGLQPLWVARKL